MKAPHTIEKRDTLIEHMRRDHAFPHSRYYWRPLSDAAIRGMHDDAHGCEDQQSSGDKS